MEAFLGGKVDIVIIDERTKGGIHTIFYDCHSVVIDVGIVLGRTGRSWERFVPISSVGRRLLDETNEVRQGQSSCTRCCGVPA